MFKNWKKVDIFLAALFILTNLCYIFCSGDLFKIFLWTLIISGSIRFLFFIKKKLFWRVRNRLIFSSLFLVITPLIFLLIFFFIFLNIVIAQYGITIVDNIMADRLNQLEILSENYFSAGSNSNMIKLINRAVVLDQRVNYLNAVFFEKRGNEYSSFYKYPADFNETKINIENYRGYFFLEKKLYHGIIKKKGNLAILFATTISQKFLDEFSTISDFKIKYQDPSKDVVFDLPQRFSEDNKGDETFFLPHILEYTYLDFDNLKNFKPVKRKKNREMLEFAREYYFNT